MEPIGVCHEAAAEAAEAQSSSKATGAAEVVGRQQYIIKQDGSLVLIDPTRITHKIKKFAEDLVHVDVDLIIGVVINGLCNKVTTEQLDELTVQVADNLTTTHYQYSDLAVRIALDRLYKKTPSKFSDAMKLIPRLDPHFLQLVNDNVELLDAMVDNEKYDADLTYFGFKTLEHSYLQRSSNGTIVERPQYLNLRVAVAIHGDNWSQVYNTYTLLAKKYATHASSTLCQAGLRDGQLASCFLLTLEEGGGIPAAMETLGQCGLISATGGGIGVSISQACPTTLGPSPVARVYEQLLKEVRQEANNRPGAWALYLEPWHNDIVNFLNLRTMGGSEDLKAKHLFYGLWIPDLFMYRVEHDQQWSLFIPRKCPIQLDTVWGEEFERLYCQYEKAGLYESQLPARTLWLQITQALTGTGGPYLMFKDACNRKSNHQNFGCIKGSNLCTEIVQYTDENEIAVCNLASIAVNKFVAQDGTFNYDLLRVITDQVARNLDLVITKSYYPLPEARASNFKHRPMGIGIQGLADLFLLMKLPWNSAKAKLLNKNIFETIYFSALNASVDMAIEKGVHPSYPITPAAMNMLQQDFWNLGKNTKSSSSTDGLLYDWDSLRARIAKHGLRNSLLTAVMPTASSAQIMGNTESIEAITSNIYARGVAAGTFQVVNRHLVDRLVALKLWSVETKNSIILHQGSVQHLPISQEDKALYKTVWELSQKIIIELATDRAPYIDQSQSLNLHIAKASHRLLSSLYFTIYRNVIELNLQLCNSLSSFFCWSLERNKPNSIFFY
jgi:ribonucleoside-diphosphate reductase subunit M1